MGLKWTFIRGYVFSGDFETEGNIHLGAFWWDDILKLLRVKHELNYKHIE